MKLAYLTSQYPKVSHTFVRREIRELERRGHRILRLAIRRPEAAVVDPQDREEATRTLYCLGQPWHALVAAVPAMLLRRPREFACAMRLAIQMGRSSERGLARHLAYLVEACALARVVQREGVDHIHVHFGTNPAAVGRLIHALIGTSYSMTVHGPAEFDAPLGFDLAGKILDAEFVVAVSQFGATQLCRWVDPDLWPKIRVVHCSVDPAFFVDSSPITDDCDTLVCVGRLTPQKGPLLLIDALAALCERGVQARLVLAGDGELRGAVERRIFEADIGENVTITGWLSEEQVRAHIAASRCLVLPSWAEGLPVVLMEAFAMGRPVVTTHVAGIPELVRPGENGWLVPAGDLEGLVRAMQEALRTPAARLNEMGQAGRERVRRYHAVETEVDALEKLLRDGISRARPSPPWIPGGSERP